LSKHSPLGVLKPFGGVPFNDAQLSTWADAIKFAKIINGSPLFLSAGIQILPQDPNHQHSGTYIPSWVSGPGGFQEPVDGNKFFIHYRFTNNFEGMNSGLVQDKFSRFPLSPAYVLGQLLKEVQQGART
jgi:hypothetical protein